MQLTCWPVVHIILVSSVILLKLKAGFAVGGGMGFCYVFLFASFCVCGFFLCVGGVLNEDFQIMIYWLNCYNSFRYITCLFQQPPLPVFICRSISRVVVMIIRCFMSSAVTLCVQA